MAAKFSWLRFLHRTIRAGAIAAGSGSRAHLQGAACLEPLELRVLLSGGSAGLTIIPTFESSVTSLPNAAAVEGAVNDVIQQYEQLYSNHITININVQATTDSGILSDSSYSIIPESYNTIRSAVLANDPGLTIPAADPVAGNPSWFVTTAQAKALGLSSGAGSDGTFTFNSDVNWTFDPSNRAVAGEWDFIGAAEHEISEIMGRSVGLGAPGYLEYDLFRYTGPGALDLTNGNGIWFSTDGGATLQREFNFPNGNGSDPQDWASGTVDSYDAFQTEGVENPIMPVDLNAMEAVGYTLGAALAPPTVTANPTSLSVSTGNTATFTAAASGNPAPTVQWQVSTDGGTTFTNIAGANATSYSFDATEGQSGCEFQAVFTNSQGPATTAAAMLTVTPPLAAPTLTANPTSLTVNAGDVATFTAAADGSPAPAVQWQVSTNGGVYFTNIAGATSTPYSFIATAGQTGNEFRAIFTNSQGLAITTEATLTVNAALPAPVGVTALGLSQAVRVTWSAVSGATSYNVYRSTTSGAEGSTPYCTDVSATSLTDTGLAGGITYYYQVTAVDSDFESARSVEVSASPAATLELTTPVTSSSINVGSTYQIDWTGGNPTDTVQLWLLGGPNNSSTELAAALPQTQGHYTWNTTGVAHGWYSFQAWDIPGDGAAPYVVPSPNYLHVVAPGVMPPIVMLTDPGVSGQHVSQGATFILNWGASDGLGDTNPLSVQLWVYSGNTGLWTELPNANNLPASQGYYEWDTTGMAPGWYSFSIHASDGDLLSSAASPGWLNITVPAPTITYLTPAGGQSAASGGSFNLAWSIGGLSAADLANSTVQIWGQYVSNGSAVWTEITASVNAANGSYAWTVPSSPGASTYYAFSIWLNYGDEWWAQASTNWLQVM